MDKKEVAAALEEMALLLELAGENPFKVRAFETGARAVLTFGGDLAEAVRRGILGEVKGIGKSLAGVITELMTTGEAGLRAELRAKFPPGLLELLQVPGLGPKKAKVLFEQLHITGLGELEYALQENRLLSLPGFGAKTQEKLKAGLERLKRYAGLFRLGDLWPWGQECVRRLRQEEGVIRAEVAGGVRRGLEVDDTLVITAAFSHADQAQGVLAGLFPGLAPSPQDSRRFEGFLPQGVRLQIQVTEAAHFGAAWLFATGNAHHLEELQERARGAGLALSPEGLGTPEGVLAAEDEAGIYEALGLAFIIPELREGQGEVAAAAQGRLPRSLQAEEVRGCLHVHSHYSDGVNSLEELAAEAQRRGWDFLGISDHSQSAYYAGGLKIPDLERQRRELAACQARFPGVRLFWGIESDILGDGSLDYPEEVLRDFDFVIASVHSQFQQSREAMTRRLLTAMANPWCTVVGHVSGRLLLAREGYDVDLDAILTYAGREQVIMELNASPYRLDLDWRWLKRAKELGVLVSLNPDAHNLEGLDDMSYGVTAARKGWLEARDVINTYSPAEVARLLGRRRPERG
jgi:DNA polymerase (family 10)